MIVSCVAYYTFIANEIQSNNKDKEIITIQDSISICTRSITLYIEMEINKYQNLERFTAIIFSSSVGNFQVILQLTMNQFHLVGSIAPLHP